MRRKIVAGNWKMHKSLNEAIQLTSSLCQLTISDDTLVILGVPFPYLLELKKVTERSTISIAAQNCHHKAQGAFTGEVSAPMLASIDTEYVILGHSERRAYFKESDQLLAEKTNIALENGLKVIFCCGESLEVRRADNHIDFVSNQLSAGLFHLTPEQLDRVTIAYEPIWAIGTGETASPEQAQEMHHAIRHMLEKKYDQTVADQMHILYGGSVKAANAGTLFNQPDVDGGLVGGASLKADDFAVIIGA